MKKAFTLIELLVVIAIIAILAAILFPVFAQAKAAAKASANLSNLKQDGLGLIQYSADSDDIFPLAVRYETPAGQQAAFNTTENLTTSPAGAIPWTEAAYAYTKNRDIYTSPLESSVSGTGFTKSFKQAQFYGVVPSGQAINQIVNNNTNTAYLLQTPLMAGATGGYIDGPFGYADGRTNNPISAPSKSQTSIDKVAEVIMISDAGAYDQGYLGGTFANGTSGTTGTPARFTPYAINNAAQWGTAPVYAGPWGRKNTSGAWNGGKVANFVQGQRGQTTSCFTDGHAASQDISKTYELRSIDGTTTNMAAYRMYSGSTQ